MTPNIFFLVSAAFPSLLQWMTKYQPQSWDLKHSLKIPGMYMSPCWRKSGPIEPCAHCWIMKDNGSHFTLSIWKHHCAAFLNLFQTEHCVKTSFKTPCRPLSCEECLLGRHFSSEASFPSHCLLNGSYLIKSTHATHGVHKRSDVWQEAILRFSDANSLS